MLNATTCCESGGRLLANAGFRSVRSVGLIRRFRGSGHSVRAIVVLERPLASYLRCARHFNRVLKLVSKHRNSRGAVEREAKQDAQDAIGRGRAKILKTPCEAPI